MHPTMVNESLGWTYKVVDYVVFPMGLVVDETHLYVSYGKNDKSSWVLKLDRRKFLAGLKPVRTRVVGQSQYDKSGGEIDRFSYTESSESPV